MPKKKIYYKMRTSTLYFFFVVNPIKMYIQKFWSDYKTIKFGSHQGTNCKLVKINETEKGELFNKTPSVSLSTCRPIYPKQMPKITSDCPTVHTTSNPTPNNKTHTTQPTLALPRTAGPLHYLLASYPRQWPATRAIFLRRRFHIRWWVVEAWREAARVRPNSEMPYHSATKCSRLGWRSSSPRAH